MQGLALLAATLRMVRVLREGEESIKENPVKLYDIAQEFLPTFAIAIWIHLTWTKKGGLADFIRKSYDFVPIKESTASFTVIYKYRVTPLWINIVRRSYNRTAITI